jgi:hypothetical protein
MNSPCSNVVYTDLDWTLLNKWVLSNETSKTISELRDNWVSVVSSTWKWFPRLPDEFKDWTSILEAWARIVSPSWEQDFDSIENENLWDLTELVNKLNIDWKINFMFLYPNDLDSKHAMFFIRDQNNPLLAKFKWIREKNAEFDVNEFWDYVKTIESITMLNLHVNAKSLEELWLSENYKWLKLVFNEWMLNISVTDKWKAINKLVNWHKYEKIAIAWNDTNDIPAFEEAVRLAEKQVADQVWIILVWWYPYEVKNTPNNLTILNAPSPEFISEPLKQFFNI